MQDIKVRHKYAVGEEKQYPGFSKILIEMANERTYDRQIAKGRNDMDVDAIEAEKAAQQAAYTEVDSRDHGGEEYTPERYRQMEVDGAKGQVFVKEDPSDTAILRINNDDFENFHSVKELNKLVGLEWEDVDSKTIADINMKRMENLNLEM